DGVPQAGVRGCLLRRLRPVGFDVGDVPLPHALHPGRARLLALAGWAPLPAALTDFVLRRPDRRSPLDAGSAADAAGRRHGARRRRAAADGWPERELGVDASDSG